MDLIAEMRRRLNLAADELPDVVAEHFLSVALANIAPFLGEHPEPNPFQPLIDEATVELAIKVYDVSGRGTIVVDPAGDFTMPAPSATPGMVRSVFGVLGPAMATGGVSV